MNKNTEILKKFIIMIIVAILMVACYTIGYYSDKPEPVCSETKLEKIRKRFYRIRTQILVSALYEMSDAHWGLRKYADALKEQDSLYAEFFNELLAEKLEEK